MRSALPKVLHPICGRPMILWPLLAARAAGAERVIVVDNPKRRLAEHLPDGVECAIQEEPRGTGDAVAAAAGLLDPAAPVLVINGDMPLITGEAIAGLVAAHAEAQGRRDARHRWSSTTRRATAAWSAARTASSSAWSRPRPTGDATPEELAIREVNAGLYLVRRRRARSPRSPTSAATTPRASCYLPDVVPLLLAAGTAVQAYPLADPDLALGVNDRVDLAHVTRLAQERIHRGPPARRRDDRGPGEHADRGRRDDRQRHDDRAVHVPPRRHRIGERCTGRPADHADRLDARRRRHRPARLPRRRDRRRRRHGRPVRLPAPRRRAAARTPRSARSSRSRTPTVGPGAKVPHLSYIGDADIGAGIEHRRGHDHRQLRRPRASTARRSATACASRSTPPSSLP